MLILHTAIRAAWRSWSSGTPMASFRAPPLALMSSTYLGVTEDAPWRTMGKPGRRLETSSRMSKRSWGLVPGLNLKAPWLVPMAMARLSTPVARTNSSTCSGLV